MTTAQYSFRLAGDVNHTSYAGIFQPIDADYYNIADGGSGPVAGLLVLVDGKHSAVRAELHLYEDLPSHISEAAVRQARALLQERYHGLDPLPLRILQTYQRRDAVDVTLPVEAVARPRERNPQWLTMAALAVAAIIVVAAIWLSSSLFQTGEPAATVNGAPAVAAASDALAGEVAPSVQPPELAATGAAVTLPQSRNADSRLSIGERVRILPGLRLTLRSEAGADAGVAAGFMADGQQAVITAGPALTQGSADTIVWWYVRLEDGTEGWAAANTSQQRLLEPVP